MFVQAASPAIAGASGTLAALGAQVEGVNAGAAIPTTSVIPPAPEPASILAAAMHLAHSADYQAFAQMGAVFHAMFVTNIGAAAASYAGCEVANMATML
jgi:hypothetical protein